MFSNLMRKELFKKQSKSLYSEEIKDYNDEEEEPTMEYVLAEDEGRGMHDTDLEKTEEFLNDIYSEEKNSETERTDNSGIKSESSDETFREPITIKVEPNETLSINDDDLDSLNDTLKSKKPKTKNEKKALHKLRDRRSSRQVRSTLTLDQKEAIRKKSREQKRTERENQTEEQKEESRKQAREQKRTERANQTEEHKEARRKQAREQKRIERANMTEEQKEKRRKQSREQKRTERANMTEEQKEERRKIESEQQKSQVFFCDQCGHKASRKASLRAHIESIHENIVYSCDQMVYSGDQCTYKTKHKRSLKNHIENIH